MSSKLIKRIENCSVEEINKWLKDLEKTDKSYMPNLYYYCKVKKLLWEEKIKKLNL